MDHVGKINCKMLCVVKNTNGYINMMMKEKIMISLIGWALYNDTIFGVIFIQCINST